MKNRKSKCDGGRGGNPVEKYFAYGSNLHYAQMQNRCPSARFFSIGKLIGYELAFPLLDGEWQGGVAGVIPKELSVVEGVVYEISQADFMPLDIYEGVENGEYYRKQTQIQLPSGTFIEAWIYFAGKSGNYLPSKQYMEAIISGAMYHGLSESYLSKLKEVPHAN